MKQQYILYFFFLVICLLSFQENSFAQNVGIGTNTPLFKLDVKGGINADSGYNIGGNRVLTVKGIYNTFVGTNSGIVNTTGSYNTAIGNTALWLNSIGSYNTAIGPNTLFVNTNGGYNVAIGPYALFRNTSGYANTATGGNCLINNTTGGNNAAHGYRALYNNTTGSHNTASGISALYSNTTGDENIGSGNKALFGNTTGKGNIALGYETLFFTTASSYNTILGYHAGFTNNLGWNNTLIGADCNVTASGIYNSVGLGNAVSVTASNVARIANNYTVSIGGFANWTAISDGRFKKNIQEDVKGLAFIMKLRPVTYHLDVSGISEKINNNKSQTLNADMQTAAAEKEKIIQSGFIAQEVEQAAKELGYDFSGVDKPKNESDFYGLRYAEFVVPLVKAVQEQQQQIDDLKKIIKELHKQ